MSPAARVCVVGAGIAGVACARVLVAGGVPTLVVDRSLVVGGRMASRTLAGRPVDTGAQYFTVAGEGFRAVVQEWSARGLARPWTDAIAVHEGGELRPPKAGPMRWAAPLGLRSLVADLAAGLDVRSSTTVAHVGRGPTVDGAGCDAVVLAMPDPQALRLLDPALDAERAQLRGREWQPQLSLLCGWPSRRWDLDAAFINDSDVLSFVADDGTRRGDSAPVLVAHSTPTFAAPHLPDPDAAGPAMVAALSDVLRLPGVPSWTRVQRWGFAKPATPRDEPCFLGPDRVGLCGDGWGASKVETAWTSGDALGRALLATL